ncbi:MAG: hypothetical protein JEZ10_03510 [Verrucomicrobia bacterium]|nr:hypothetical protein [Verrucomicrobiota bacterium]
MHTQTDRKPIGKCGGCPSNLKKQCAVFEHPHEQWSKGHCKGYMNEQMYADYLKQQAVIREKTHKEIRQEKAAELKTLTHQDGVLNPTGIRR